MSSIDERIVELQFRNAQFEQGIKTTIESLERLESSLQVNTGGLQESVRGIADNLETVKSRFGAFGAIGFSALNTLTNAAIGAGKSMASALVDPIVEGGKKRALNIAQAKFQFEGLGMDIEATMADALYAVKDTAFGLDEAAVAASNFGATGMRAGDEMRNALRGISGVAAMAGASYTDVANIFGKVAGQGRLMGDDLNRLAARGINAAATLATQMGISEGAVREMVTKGKISFAEFSSAMNVAFGDQATKANELYTGALSNVRAALARIGASFAAPKFEAQRRMLVALIPIIDNVHAALKPLISVYTELVGQVADRVEKFFGNQIGVFANFMASLQKWVQGFANIYVAIRSYLAPIGSAFASVFSPKSIPFTQWANAFARFTERLRAGSETADKIKRAFSGFFSIFKIGFDILGGGIRIIVSFFAALLGKPMQGVGKLSDFFLDLFANVGDVITRFREWMHEGDRFNKIISAIQSGIKVAADVLRDFGSRLGDVWQAIRAGDWGAFKAGMASAMSVFNPFKEKLAGLGAMAMTALGNVAGSIGDWFKGLDLGFFDFLAGIFDKLSEKLEEVKENITDVKPEIDTDALKAMRIKLPKITFDISSVKESIKDVWAQIAASFEKSQNVIGPIISRAFGFVGDVILGTIDFIKTRGTAEILAIVNTIFFVILNKRFKEAIGAFSGMGDAVKGLFAAIGSPFEQMQKNLASAAKGNFIIKFAVAIGILAAALWVLAKIPADDLKRGVGVIAGLAVGLMLALKVFEGVDVDKGNYSLVKIGVALVGLGIAMSLFASAAAKFGQMDTGSLIKGVGAVSAILLAFTLFTRWGDMGSMTIKGALSLILLSAGLFAIALAVERFSTMKWETVGEGLGIMTAALIAMTAALYLIPADSFSRALAIVAVVGALWLLAEVIDRLSTVGNKAETLTTLGLALAGVVAALMFASAPGVVGGSVALLAAAGAIWILGDAIARLSEIDPAAQGNALKTLAVALGLITAAAIIGYAFWPGFAVLAAVLIAVGIAAAGIGWGLNQASDGLTKFMDSAATLERAEEVAGMIDILSDAIDRNRESIGPLIGMASGLILLSVGLALFGVSAVLAGAGLTAAGIGLALFSRYGDAGAESIRRFLDEFNKWDMAEMTVLGAALAVLGAGMLVVGAGALLIGAGFIVMAAGVLSLTTASAIAGVVSYLLVPAIENLAGQVGNIKAIGSAVYNAALKITIAAAAFTAFYDSLSNFGDVITRAKGHIDGFKDSFLGFQTSVAQVTTSTGVSVSLWAASFAKPFETAKTNMQTHIDGIIKAIKDLESKIKTALESAARSAEQSSGKIVKAIDNLKTRVSAALNSMKSTVTSSATAVGVAIGTGMIAGINSQSGRVTAAATAMASRAVSAARSRLAVASPSKVFEEMGTFVAMGLAKGISGNSHLAADSSARMANTAITTASNVLGIASPSKEFIKIGKSVNEGFAEGIRGNRDQVTNAFESLISELDSFKQQAKTRVDDLQKTYNSVSAQNSKNLTNLRRAQANLRRYNSSYNRSQVAKYQTAYDKSSKSLKNYANQLAEARRELNGTNAALALLNKEQAKYTDKMDVLQKKKSPIVERLEEERRALEAAQSAYDDYNKSVKESYDNVSDITGEDTTVMSYLQAMEKQILETSAFTDVMDKLAKMGLNDELYRELVAKGVDAMPFALSLLESGGEGIAAVNELGGKLISVSERIGKDAADQLYLAGVQSAQGIVKGLESQESAINAQIEKLAETMINSLKNKLGIKSPSRVFAKLGNATAEGFSHGLTGYNKAIQKSAENMGNDAINSLRKSISGLSKLVDGDVELNPTITPVLDLSNLEKNAHRIGNMFGHQVIDTEAAYNSAALAAKSRRASIRNVDETGVTSVPPGATISYVQNNHSPKALSNVEIYRQTRNQLSTVKGALDI